MEFTSNIIFIDTSIFVSENYMYGRKINALVEFSKKGIIEIKVTDIIYNEVKKRMKSDLVRTKNIFKQTNRDLNDDGRILKNIESFKPYYPIPKINVSETLKDLETKFDKFLKDFNIEIIDISYSNKEDVFTQYFQGKPPFGEGRKKTEFPDAFTLSTIEGWCNSNKTDAFILSTDKDVMTYSSPSNKVIPISNISELLETLLQRLEEKKIEFVNSFIDEGKFDITTNLPFNFEEKMTEIVADKIKDNNPYYEDLDYELVEIESIYLNEQNITNIISDSVWVDFDIGITFEMKLWYADYSTAFYDKEDGNWWGEEFIEEKGRYEVRFNLSIEFIFDIENSYFLMERLEDYELIDFEQLG